MKFFKDSFPVLWFTSWIGYSAVSLLTYCSNRIRSMYTLLVRAGMSAANRSGKHRRTLARLMSLYLASDQLNIPRMHFIKQGGFEVPASLAAAIILRNAYNSGSKTPEWKINEKSAGLRFARTAGLEIPETFFKHAGFLEISPVPGMVIKPEEESAARGVFIVKSLNHIIELKTGMTFISWKQLTERVQELLSGKAVKKDLWMAERYICDAEGKGGRDVKFYTFYGHLGWISEIIRYPKPLHYTIDRQGKEIDYGFYPLHTMFKGDGASVQEIEMVERISLEIPVPFIRIDFLRGEYGLFFNEFTPSSGILGHINKTLDKRFGRMYHAANARLQTDLVSGKKFELFTAATS